MLKKKADGRIAKFAFGALGGMLLVDAAVAGSYNSSVVLPAVHARYYTYTATVPLKGSPPSTGKINNVTWNWSVEGWPKSFTVKLCHGDLTKCIDISRIRSGSSAEFNGKSPNQSFIFALQAGGDTLVPVGGHAGVVDVSW